MEELFYRCFRWDREKGSHGKGGKGVEGKNGEGEEEEEIFIREIREALSRLKEGKAMGLGGIPWEA